MAKRKPRICKLSLSKEKGEWLKQVPLDLQMNTIRFVFPNSRDHIDVRQEKDGSLYISAIFHGASQIAVLPVATNVVRIVKGKSLL